MAQKSTQKDQLEITLLAGYFNQFRNWVQKVGLAACNVGEDPSTECLVALSLWRRLNKKGEITETEVSFFLQMHEAFAVQTLAFNFVDENENGMFRALLLQVNPYVIQITGRMRTYYAQHVEEFEKERLEERPHTEQVAIAEQVNQNLAEKEAAQVTELPKKQEETKTENPLNYSQVIRRIMKTREEQGLE